MIGKRTPNTTIISLPAALRQCVFKRFSNFGAMHILTSFLSLILRIEKRSGVCYIIVRKGDTNVQVMNQNLSERIESGEQVSYQKIFGKD